MGDTDINGTVDNRDITSTISKIMGNTPERFNENAADLNGDGIINVLDITAIVDIINGQPLNNNDDTTQE